MKQTAISAVMSSFATEVAALSWTNPGANLYKSPVDGDGRFFDILLTDQTAASVPKLEWRVRDQNAVTITTRRVNGPANAVFNAHIYTGAYHAYIDFEWMNAAPEALIAGIVDMTPEAQSAHTHYVYGHGSRTTGDALSSNTIVNASMNDNVTPAVANRTSMYYSTSGTNSGGYMTTGERIWRPVEFWCQPTGGGNYRYAGRAYQMLVTYSDIVEAVDYTVPIDAGTTAKFRTIQGWTTTNNHLAAGRSG
jgi:hypothetical protein